MEVRPVRLLQLLSEKEHTCSYEALLALFTDNKGFFFFFFSFVSLKYSSFIQQGPVSASP